MQNDQLPEFVKKLEPFFIGFTAEGNSLKNANGMEICFRVDWKNKTIVSGLHAKHRHSIGCSFEKTPEKIFKDIRRRLFPEYYTDFFKTKKENLEIAEAEEINTQKLKALASVIGGEVSRHYGHRGASGNDYISTENVSIYPTYQGDYEINVTLDYIDAMKIAKHLKDFFRSSKTGELNS